eukprot:g3792.t1
MQTIVSALKSRDISLTDLDISQNKVGPKCAAELLKSLLKNNTLTHLNVENTLLTGDGTDFIALQAASQLLLENTTLLSLSMGENVLTDYGASLAGVINFSKSLSTNTTLQTLSLRNCLIGAKGCSLLVESIGSGTSRIRHLNLSGNSLRIEGAKSFAQLFHLEKIQKLETLDISNNDLCSYGDDQSGLVALILSLKNNTNLRSLNVANNHIKPKTLGTIASMLTSNYFLVDLQLFPGNIDIVSSKELRKQVRNRLQCNTHIKKIVENEMLVNDTFSSHGIFYNNENEVKGAEKGVGKESLISSLHEAVIVKNVEAVRYLVETCKASIEVKDGRGWSPLRYATDIRHGVLTNYLLSKGANPNSKDSVAETCLHSAVLDGDGALAELLIRHGASLTAQNIHGVTPLEKTQSMALREQLMLQNSNRDVWLVCGSCENDHRFAKRVQNIFLKNHKMTAWLDDEMSAQQTQTDDVAVSSQENDAENGSLDQLLQSVVMCFIVSSYSIKSPLCLSQFDLAKRNRMKICCLWIERPKLNLEMERRFSGCNFFDFTGDGMGATFDFQKALLKNTDDIAKLTKKSKLERFQFTCKELIPLVGKEGEFYKLRHLQGQKYAVLFDGGHHYEYSVHVRHALEQNKIPCFSVIEDKNSSERNPALDTILQAIAKCSVVIVILSELTAQSSNLLLYIETAAKYKKQICSIIYSDFVIPLELRRVHALMEGPVVSGHSKAIRGRECNVDFPQSLQAMCETINGTIFPVVSAELTDKRGQLKSLSDIDFEGNNDDGIRKEIFAFHELHRLISAIEKTRFKEDVDESTLKVKLITEQYNKQLDRYRELEKKLEKVQSELSRSRKVNQELSYCVEYYKSKIETEIEKKKDDEKKSSDEVVDVMHLSPPDRLKYLKVELQRLRDTRKTTVVSAALHGYDQTYVRLDLIKQIKKLIRSLRKSIAVTKIQAGFRGHMSRTKLHDGIRTKSAVKIQSQMRRFLVVMNAFK